MEYVQKSFVLVLGLFLDHIVYQHLKYHPCSFFYTLANITASSTCRGHAEIQGVPLLKLGG